MIAEIINWFPVEVQIGLGVFAGVIIVSVIWALSPRKWS